MKLLIPERKRQHLKRMRRLDEIDKKKGVAPYINPVKPVASSKDISTDIQKNKDIQEGKRVLKLDNLCVWRDSTG